MIKDQLFKQRISQFSFDQNVSAVFDDMLSRSVPMYHEMQRLIVDIVGKYGEKGTTVYDLGCATGTTLKMLVEQYPHLKYIGMDYSLDVLEKTKEKLEHELIQKKVVLQCNDLNDGVDIENASVVILNLTLQFVQPENRRKVLATIYDGLLPGGCLILIEKILPDNKDLSAFYEEIYYKYKMQNGYSREEIENKKRALKGVLIPKTPKENIALLKEVGFKKNESFLQWLNFWGIMAIKDD